MPCLRHRVLVEIMPILPRLKVHNLGKIFSCEILTVARSAPSCLQDGARLCKMGEMFSPLHRPASEMGQGVSIM